MQDIFGMQVLDTKTNLYENLPNEILSEKFVVLLFYVSIEIPVVAKFHNNVDLSVLYEGIKVPYHIG